MESLNTGLTITQELISSVSAQLYLDGQKFNRSLNETRVADLSRQMTEGLWKPLCSFIAFDKQGQLIDGQHRMAAMVKSRTCQRFFVVRGYDQGVFDLGQSRTATNIIDIVRGEHVGTKLVAAIKYASFLPLSTQCQMSGIELGQFLGTHEDAARFAARRANGSKAKGEIGLIAPMMAFLLKAYYHESQEDLCQFIEAFKSGIATDMDHNPAIALRNEYISYNRKFQSLKNMPEFYYKVQKAFVMFVRGEKSKNRGTISLKPSDRQDLYGFK